ncbi:hypothetical protein WN944_020431 [Citrus x changshan-huyou]|uniref:Uncharacterized protein n=1 Tax=Citrus x changshan-huyou TaxID=2935761 RepID=A0AAP0LYJ4_9ROSI
MWSPVKSYINFRQVIVILPSLKIALAPDQCLMVLVLLLGYRELKTVSLRLALLSDSFGSTNGFYCCHLLSDLSPPEKPIAFCSHYNGSGYCDRQRFAAASTVSSHARI